MMSPRIKIVCCLLGIAAAGVPLVLFTGVRGEESRVAPSLRETAQAAAPAVLRCSGEPRRVCIYHEGKLLSELPMPLPGGEWRGELMLPQLQAGATLELEIKGLWNDDGGGAQAITLELAPDKLPTRRETQWTEPGGAVLHNIYTYTW